MTLLNYINDFSRVTSTESEAFHHFSMMQATLDKLGLDEAKHKASPPSQVMVWLGLHFGTVNMTMSITDEISILVASWACNKTSSTHELPTILV